MVQIMKKIAKPLLLMLAVALLSEIFVFNHAFFFSRSAKPQKVTVTASENQETKDGVTFTFPEYQGEEALANDKTEYYYEIKDINQKVQYLYLNFDSVYSKEPNELCFDVYFIDEGFSEYYLCNTIRMHPSFEKTRYIRLQPYGKLKAVKLVINDNGGNALNTEITINDAQVNARVPMFFSVFRVLLLLILMMFIYLFRPASAVYRQTALNPSRKMEMLKTIFMALNIGVLVWMLINNLTLINPNLDGYRQYNLLAEAIAQGKVNIRVPHGDLMELVANPYDRYERRALLKQYDFFVEIEPWHDMAYFNGKFYVYFGIVPELLFFLPLYLITKKHMITSGVVFIVCCLIVIAAFRLIESIVKIYFPKTTFGVALFASLVLANGMGTMALIMSPIIYNLTILSALLFVLFGLIFWFEARYLMKNDASSKRIGVYLALGALCMALVAGCRPQFIMSSFLIIPIFYDVFASQKTHVLKGNSGKLAAIAVPYLSVAAGLMYYNYIRFGSVFDFGANYNLTTNNMPLRGIRLGRVWDGFFTYFLQPPAVTARFPFIVSTKFNSNYIGLTIGELMFGGVFFTCSFVLFLFALPKVKALLQEKKLYGFIVLALCMVPVIAFMDMQMSGILIRYTYDFVYLMMISAVFILLALLEKYKNSKKIITTMVTLGMLTFVFAFFISFNSTYLQPSGMEPFYNIYQLFI